MIKRVSLLAAFAVLAGSASAQGFGGGRMMSMGASSTMSSLMLLNRTDVQEELKLDGDQKAKLDALKAGTSTRFQTVFASLRNLSQEDRQAKIQELIDDLGKEGLGVLTDDQKKRLKELAIQSAGTLVVLQPDVQKEVVLTAAQKAKIDDLQRKQNEANEGLMEQLQNGDIDRDELSTRMQKNRKTMEDLVIKLLSDTQRTKLKALGGKPFEFKDPKPGVGNPFGRPGG